MKIGKINVRPRDRERLLDTIEVVVFEIEPGERSYAFKLDVGKNSVGVMCPGDKVLEYFNPEEVKLLQELELKLIEAKIKVESRKYETRFVNEDTGEVLLSVGTRYEKFTGYINIKGGIL